MSAITLTLLGDRTQINRYGSDGVMNGIRAPCIASELRDDYVLRVQVVVVNSLVSKFFADPKQVDCQLRNDRSRQILLRHQIIRQQTALDIFKFRNMARQIDIAITHSRRKHVPDPNDVLRSACNFRVSLALQLEVLVGKVLKKRLWGRPLVQPVILALLAQRRKSRRKSPYPAA